jgi:threonyl-tRNA synthetase
MFKDAIGRQHQLATVQVDFNLPQRFDLSFVNESGENERPVVIHRAIAGSLERFMGVMIEHFAGAFPLWMAPIQMMIVPVADVFNEYAKATSDKLQATNLRSKIDLSSDSFAKKIRNAELLKIPYILIVGEKEVSDNSVSVRVYKTKEQYTMSVEEFVAKMGSEVKERVL